MLSDNQIMTNLENKTIESWNKVKSDLNKLPIWEKTLRYLTLILKLLNLSGALISVLIAFFNFIKITNFPLKDRVNDLAFASALMSAIHIGVDWALSSRREKIEKENVDKKFNDLEKELHELRKQLTTKQKKD